jgi:NADH:ubiquinone oxidoreductase subunit D
VYIDFSTSGLAEAQKNDPHIGLIHVAIKQTGEKPSWKSLLPVSEQTKVYWTQWEQLILCEDVLY